jgi:preprotein translocase subunit SecG
MAFVSLFYLLFVSKINSCADLFGAVQMLFQMTVMKYSTSEFIGADATLGPLCFSMFILIVVFICLSMFLSIINDNFRRARKNRRESEMLSFMMQRFLRWTGKHVLFN